MSRRWSAACSRTEVKRAPAASSIASQGCRRRGHELARTRSILPAQSLNRLFERTRQPQGICSGLFRRLIPVIDSRGSKTYPPAAAPQLLRPDAVGETWRICSAAAPLYRTLPPLSNETTTTNLTTGFPSTANGWYRHCLTALVAASTSRGFPSMTLVRSTVPSSLSVTSNTTSPQICSSLAEGRSEEHTSELQSLR